VPHQHRHGRLIGAALTAPIANLRTRKTYLQQILRLHYTLTVAYVPTAGRLTTKNATRAERGAVSINAVVKHRVARTTSDADDITATLDHTLDSACRQ